MEALATFGTDKYTRSSPPRSDPLLSLIISATNPTRIRVEERDERIACKLSSRLSELCVVGRSSVAVIMDIERRRKEHSSTVRSNENVS